jgi:hypothetical protein
MWLKFILGFFLSSFNQNRSNSVRIAYKEEKETHEPQICYCQLIHGSRFFSLDYFHFLFVELNKEIDKYLYIAFSSKLLVA